MISIKYDNIPTYLHDSQFYKNLTSKDDVTVPHCKNDIEFNNINEFSNLVDTIMYWGFDGYLTFEKYCEIAKDMTSYKNIIIEKNAQYCKCFIGIVTFDPADIFKLESIQNYIQRSFIDKIRNHEINHLLFYIFTKNVYLTEYIDKLLAQISIENPTSYVIYSVKLFSVIILFNKHYDMFIDFYGKMRALFIVHWEIIRDDIILVFVFAYGKDINYVKNILLHLTILNDLLINNGLTDMLFSITIKYNSDICTILIDLIDSNSFQFNKIVPMIIKSKNKELIDYYCKQHGEFSYSYQRDFIRELEKKPFDNDYEFIKWIYYRSVRNTLYSDHVVEYYPQFIQEIHSLGWPFSYQSSYIAILNIEAIKDLIKIDKFIINVGLLNCVFDHLQKPSSNNNTIECAKYIIDNTDKQVLIDYYNEKNNVIQFINYIEEIVKFV